MTAKRAGLAAMVTVLGIGVGAGAQAPAMASGYQPASCALRSVAAPAVPASDSANLTAVAMTGPSRGWAAGFTLASRNPRAAFQPLLAGWNGRSWRTVALRLGVTARLDGLAARSAGDVWAVGTASSNQKSMNPLTLHWNGHRWTRVAAAGVPGYAYVLLLGVAARSSTDAWAVGEAERAGTAAVRPVIEHWNGHRWTLMKNPPVPPQTALGSVAVAANGQAWAVGTPFSNSRRGVVLHWTGRSWVTARTPATSASVLLDGVTVAGSDVWAVGTASNAAGVFTPYALRWNGRGWASVRVPALANGQFESVAAIGHGQLAVAGSFRNGAVCGLWNGSGWAVRTSSRITQLNSVAFDGRALWAVGSVSTSAQTFRPVVQVNG